MVNLEYSRLKWSGAEFWLMLRVYDVAIEIWVKRSGTTYTLLGDVIKFTLKAPLKKELKKLL